ncbi:hypothetical protein SF06_13290 [Pseudomonas flexibilis]|nr:hypothetical protein SF06_13290 [Pseudomonas flexibilis]
MGGGRSDKTLSNHMDVLMTVATVLAAILIDDSQTVTGLHGFGH